MSYLDEWEIAIERTRRFNLTLPSLPGMTGRLFDEKRQSEFPYVVREALGELEAEDLAAQCLSIHYRLAPIIEQWLGCPVAYTLGWVDDESENGLFRFGDAFIEETLNKPIAPGSSVKIHAWLTLPSMEIIDASLATSFSKAHHKPEWEGLVLTKHADELKGMAYKPVLVGDDFLHKAGLLHSFITL